MRSFQNLRKRMESESARSLLSHPFFDSLLCHADVAKVTSWIASVCLFESRPICFKANI